MDNTYNYSPELAKETLLKARAEVERDIKQIIRSFKRIGQLIIAAGDFSFLQELGYQDQSQECFEFVTEELYLRYVFSSALLTPLHKFMAKVPAMLFYQPDISFSSRIITNDELFEALQLLSPENIDLVLQRLARSTNSLEALKLSLSTQDKELFVSTIKKDNVDTTLLGKIVYSLTQFREVATTKPELVHQLSILEQETTLSMRVPEGVPFFLDSSHYLTKKNCVRSFVSAWNTVSDLFRIEANYAYALYSNQDTFPIQIREGISVFLQDDYFLRFITYLKERGYLDRVEASTVEQTNTNRFFQELRPLAPPPTALASDQHSEVKWRSFFTKMVRDDKHWLQKEDEESFLYLLNVKKERPLNLRPVVWNGDKFELKCLMEVLYPNRRPKQKPDYGDMAKIFCDKNGHMFKLKNTPLQCRKKVINDPVQAAREDALIQKFKIFLGVL